MDKYFTIHKNDAGTEAYTDEYVKGLQAEVASLEGHRKDADRLAAKVARLREALRQYGAHIYGCDGDPCKCGIIKALEDE